MGVEHFSGSKLVVQPIEEGDVEMKIESCREEQERIGKWPGNRLSIVSSESGKNSSESVEVLSGGTDCTTSPDTDALSTGLTPSSSSSIQGEWTID